MLAFFSLVTYRRWIYKTGAYRCPCRTYILMEIGRKLKCLINKHTFFKCSMFKGHTAGRM